MIGSRLTIVVAADDRAEARAMQRRLEARKHDVRVATDDKGALDALRAGVDACVLDLLDGKTVRDRARAAGIRTPILSLTASEEDALATRSDADAYVPKSIGFSGLLAHLDALMTRQARWTRLGDLELALASRRARFGVRELPLSATQFSLLAFLVRHVGETVTRPSILKSVFGYDFDPGTNIVDVHVAHLRSKLTDTEPVRITTVRGMGYRLDAI